MTSRHSSSDEFSISTLPSKTNYRNRVESLTHYLYDRNQGTVLGCTPLRICKLFCFYFIFYLALILFTVILGGVFYQILDWNIPTVIGPDSILNGNPGLAFRPQPNYLRTFIHYKKGDGPSTRPYIDNIESLIQFYENENQQGENFADCDAIKTRRDLRNKVCRFDLIKLGVNCVKQQNYGYDDGIPCILLKMNKIFNWEPEMYDNGTVPEEIKGHYQKYYITVSCDGELPADRENMGPLAYYPSAGFEYKYFPYLNQQGYRSPLVFVQFEDPVNGVLLMITCKVWAKNIQHSSVQKIGEVHFELLID